MIKKRNAVLLCILILLCITAAGGYVLINNAEKITKETPAVSGPEDTGFIVAEAGSFDSADTAVVVEKDEEKSTVTFQNMELGKQYTLTYNGATTIYDKYNETMSMEQIKEGDIVDITFLKGKKKLNSVRISAQGWTYTDVSRYDINELRKHMTIAEDIYKISSDTVIVSSGEQAELMDINAVDVLKVSGIGNNIYSIVIDKGHGYLRLTNDEYFVGGWIEVGQSVIQQIAEDMLLVVPEGSYEVQVSNKGNSGTKKIVINRDEEVELDIGDLKGEEPKFGTILFTVSPSDAAIYLDGQKADISQAVTLEYGIHQMIAKAAGYDTITQYIKVGQEAAGIDVTMEKSDDEEEEEEETSEEESTGSGSSSAGSSQSSSADSSQSSSSSSESEDSVSGNNGSDTETNTTGSYKVYIEAPETAEVYVDGNYVGMVPCSFKKTSGNHVVTLRKTGYKTRSYTIQLDEEEKDEYYSFNELETSDE